MNHIICALIDKKALTEDNVVTATYTVRDGVGRTLKKVGNFGIVNFQRTTNEVQFTLEHVTDKNQILVNDDNIIAIDGMDIGRYADVYNIDKNGSTKSIGKKRGRKPKNL